MGEIHKLKTEYAMPRPEYLRLKEKMAIYDKVMRKAYPFAGLSFFNKTNVRFCWTLASRHYPWQLCWQWSLRFDLRIPKASRYHWKSYIFRTGEGKIYQWGLRLGFAQLTWSRQFSDYMVIKEWFYFDRHMITPTENQ